MITLLLPFLYLPGCATIYAPAPAHVALLDEAGDLQISGHIGTNNGFNASYAVTHAISFRASGSVYGGTYPSYEVRGGFGLISNLSGEPTGALLGATLDFGGGMVQSHYEPFVWDSEVDPPTLLYKANLFSAEAQLFAARRWEHAEFGGIIRGVNQTHFLHPGSTVEWAPLRTSYFWFEPILFFRAGVRPVFLDTQLGFSGIGQELTNHATYIPVVATLGLTFLPTLGSDGAP